MGINETEIVIMGFESRFCMFCIIFIHLLLNRVYRKFFYYFIALLNRLISFFNLFNYFGKRFEMFLIFEYNSLLEVQRNYCLKRKIKSKKMFL